MLFISTERYSDFNSMIERYEQEMRKLFAEKQKISGFEEPVREVMEPLKNVVPVQEITEIKREEQPKTVPDGIGNIIVEVTTGRGAIPLPEIDVIIDRLDFDDPDGRQELIAVLETDQSGRTKPVAVKTVSRELSLVP